MLTPALQGRGPAAFGKEFHLTSGLISPHAPCLDSRHSPTVVASSVFPSLNRPVLFVDDSAPQEQMVATHHETYKYWADALLIHQDSSSSSIAMVSFSGSSWPIFVFDPVLTS